MTKFEEVYRNIDEEATELALTLEAIRGKDGFFFVGHPLDIARNILEDRADQ